MEAARHRAGGRWRLRSDDEGRGARGRLAPSARREPELVDAGLEGLERERVRELDAPVRVRGRELGRKLSDELPVAQHVDVERRSLAVLGVDGREERELLRLRPAERRAKVRVEERPADGEGV